MKKVFCVLLVLIAVFPLMAKGRTEKDRALVIQEQGAFSAGGTTIMSDGIFDPLKPWYEAQGGQTRHGDHADVFYQIPLDVKGLPLVFLHGYGQSRRSWETTADGREGFSNIFLRKGYPVYLIDQPGRGEAGQVIGSGQISAAPDDQTWFTQFRIGLWPNFYEGVQFPRDEESLDQFFRMMVPDTGTTADPNATVTALSALFNKIGGGVMITHSAGGFPGWSAAMANENVKAVIAFEPGGFPMPLDPAADPNTQWGRVPMEEFMRLTKIPILVYFGDNIPAEASGIPSQDFWMQDLQAARQFADTANGLGGDVTVVHLPEIGIYGSTHFMMSDLNNQEVAANMTDWLKKVLP